MSIENSRTIIIHGSSRANGNTTYFTDQLVELSGYEVVQLLDYEIGPFDYKFSNAGDDFLPLITKLIYNYDTLIFASPVYWYCMSGHMKVFFDRISDLLMNHKELGRQLKDKKMAVLSVSDDDEVEDCFYKVFQLSADYLDMSYVSQCHAISAAKNSEVMKIRLEKFVSEIKQA